MKRRQSRLPIIVDILTNNSVGSQEELLQHLSKRGCIVTQATLSRDLKRLRTTKVPSEMGGYRYVIADPDAPHSEGEPSSPHTQAVLSLAISGNILVIKTRNGHASGLAYDLDMLNSDVIAGTIAGGDTLLVVLSESTSAQDLYDLISANLPVDVVAPLKDRILNYKPLNTNLSNT